MSRITQTILLALTAIIMASQWSDVGANRCYGGPMGNQGEFPCNQYFHVCRRHIEGYEGYLRLPVLQEMNPWRQNKEDRELFENGDVHITFNKELSVLHAWEGISLSYQYCLRILFKSIPIVKSSVEKYKFI